MVLHDFNVASQHFIMWARIWYCIVWCCTMMQYHIVDIVHIDENMTQLIDFHSLESTFSDGMHQQGFIAIYLTHKRTGKIALAPPYLTIFWSTSKHFADVFKIPTKKTSLRRFKSVYGVWPKKTALLKCLVCFAFLQCLIPAPTRWKGFICLICINVYTSWQL